MSSDTPFYADKPMDYTPQQPQPSAPTPPAYDLVKDVTGKPAKKRGPQILIDTTGHAMKVPFPPNEKCKRCYGRGYVGNDTKTKEMIVCRKCYPFKQ